MLATLRFAPLLELYILPYSVGWQHEVKLAFIKYTHVWVGVALASLGNNMSSGLGQLA